MNHRYTLEPYTGIDSRYACPNCNHRHRFTRYIDTLTNKPLADHVGKCDRVDSCGYHVTPRDFFAQNPRAMLRVPQHDTRSFDTLPRKYVDDTAKEYERNNFVQFLITLFGAHTAIILADKYKIGTSKHWPGATIFWQIDVNDRVRTGKIMLYNRTDGHRVKVPFNHIAWVHSVLMRNAEGQMQNEKKEENSAIGIPTSDFKLKQCFFGEHLLNTDPFKIMAIVESEKTAVICSFFYPKYIWLACGSLEGLNYDKCKVLKEREVILFPDVNGYDKWKKKAREMNLRFPAARFRVNNVLERTATEEERSKGIDMADRWIEQLANGKLKRSGA
ncbi:MAG: hypothetical protein JST50_23145 [Bacteroidetes bacterium]|jgi:hypothetical protein|nr:hypothetical protein [Bacteroidota bacterium]